MVGPGTLAERHRPTLGLLAALAVGTGAPILLLALPWLVGLSGLVETAASLGLLVFAVAFPRLVAALGAPTTRRTVTWLTLFSLGLGVVSILTGFQNGLTDEPYTTPRYLGLLLAGHNPYATPLVFDYTQYGSLYASRSFYVYLPLLQFLYVPGLDYRWLSLAAWLGVLSLFSQDPRAGLRLAQPYVVLLAASGYNDLLVVLLLTLAFVGVGGRRQRWAEYLSLGVKQFANVLVVGYYLLEKDLRRAALAAAVTVAFLLPFLLWSPVATVCNALLYSVPTGCAPYSNHDATGWNWNYSLYVLWALAAFPATVAATLDRLRRRLLAPVRASKLGRTAERFVRYALVGASGIVVNLVVFTVVSRGLGSGARELLLASGAAFVVAMLWNFAWNYRWTFSDRTGRPLPVHLTLYAVFQVLALLANLVLLARLLEGGTAPLLAQFLGVAAASAIGFYANFRWNFTEPASLGRTPPPRTVATEPSRTWPSEAPEREPMPR